jgi:hypothetical protein
VFLRFLGTGGSLFATLLLRDAGLILDEVRRL